MSTETLLVELGTEELPPKALKALALAFRDGITTGLTQLGLGYGDTQWFASPRRLAVLVSAVQLQAATKELEILGPPLERAKDDSGSWTPAAIGFARKQGVEPEQLISIETPKGPRLGLRSSAEGVKAKDALPDVINNAIQNLPIPKRMRWGASRIEFVRPVHWIVVMLGQDCDHGEILGLPTGNITYGHRFHSRGPLEIDQPENYVELLLDAKVVANYALRQTLIRDQIEVEASALKATAVIDQELMGTRQTGLPEYRIANLVRDAELMPQVQITAETLQRSAPTTATAIVRRWLGDAGRYGKV